MDRNKCRLCEENRAVYFFTIKAGRLYHSVHGGIGTCKRCFRGLISSATKVDSASNIEKYQKVIETLKVMPRGSTREVAREAGVSNVYVWRIKKRLEQNKSRMKSRRPGTAAKKDQNRRKGKP